MDVDDEPTYMMPIFKVGNFVIERFVDKEGVVHEGGHITDALVAETACERWVEWGTADMGLVFAVSAITVKQTEEPVTCMLCLARMR